MIKTYGKIHLDQIKQRWIITAAQPHICIRLKAIFPKIPKYGTVPFDILHSPENCSDLNWFTDRYPLEITDTDRKKIKQGTKSYTARVNKLEAILLPDYHPVPLVLKGGHTARQYQVKSNELLQSVHRLLNGDDLGLGKTLTGILGFQNKGALPACVVCQTHLTGHWQEQIEKFTDYRVHIITARKPYSLPPGKDVYIFSYSKLLGWVDIFSTGFFKYACFDEISELRKTDSQKYQAAKVLSYEAKYVLGLSATPIYNYGDEIWAIMNLIQQNCLGDFDDFMREWTTDRKHVSDTKALGTYLRDNFLFLRRTRHDVGMELPKVNTLAYTIDCDHKEVEKHETFLRQLAVKVTTGSFHERGEASREFDMRMRQITGIAKAQHVAAFVKILLDNGEPVLLSGWHREVYKIWAEDLKDYNPCFYTGTESPSQKEASKRKFISGETNLMIISNRSAIGLDGLQARCSTVVVGELDWSPQVHAQLIARVDRFGQVNPVTAIYLLVDEGSDPVIVDVLGIKASQAHNIVDPFAVIAEVHADESRIKLMAQRLLDETGNKEAA